METYQITDPANTNYPFSKEIYEDALIVYHGTWSSYSTDIEKNGFQIGRLPFEWQDIKEITLILEAVWCKKWDYTVLKGLAKGNTIERGSERSIFVSQGFWNARNYSTFRGGETIDSAIKSIDQFIEFSYSTEKKEDVLKFLRNQIDMTRKAGSYKENIPVFENCIQNILDEKKLDEFRQKIRVIQLRFLQLTDSGCPVVYAIRVKREWFPDTPHSDLTYFFDAELEERKTYLDVNLSLEISIPPENIKAKVLYINGIYVGLNGYHPKTWEEATTV